jgi:hypothetical protein
MLASNMSHTELLFFVGGLGLLMLLFPRFFIGFSDLKAVWGGHAPIEGHPMRSPMTYRIVGVGMLLAVYFFW